MTEGQMVSIGRTQTFHLADMRFTLRRNVAVLYPRFVLPRLKEPC